MYEITTCIARTTSTSHLTNHQHETGEITLSCIIRTESSLVKTHAGAFLLTTRRQQRQLFRAVT